MKKAILMITMLIAVFALADLPAKAAPVMNEKKVYLKAGDKFKLKVKGQKGQVTWKSNKEDVATVGKKGMVSTYKSGTAWITASFKYKGKRKKLHCKICVCSMDIETLTIKRGSTYTVNVKGTKKESWESSNPDIATISKSGRIHALHAGSCTITGKVQNISFKRKIKIAGFEDGSIIMTETAGSQSLSLINVEGTIVYSSSNEKVARLLGKRLIPVGKGVCTVTASNGIDNYKCSVIIKKTTATEFVNKLETYHQYIIAHSDLFIRKYESSLKKFATVEERVSKGETVGITCVVPCRWALYALNVKRADGKALLSCNNGTFKGQYTGGVKQSLRWIKTGNAIGLSLKDAVDKGYIRKGDIIGFKGKTHTFVYSGKDYMVYEGGSSCVRDDHYPKGIMLNYGVGSYRLKQCKISEILRWKE